MKAWDWDGFFDYLVNPYLLQGAMVTLGLALGILMSIAKSKQLVQT